MGESNRNLSLRTASSASIPPYKGYLQQRLVRQTRTDPGPWASWGLLLKSGTVGPITGTLLCAAARSGALIASIGSFRCAWSTRPGLRDGRVGSGKSGSNPYED